MQFEKGLLPPSLGWREISLTALVIGLAACVAVAATSGWPRAVLAAFNKPPTPTSAVAIILSTATATPNAAQPTASPLPSATLAAPVNTPAPPPTPIPTATWFYVIPANPTPIPTPILPAAAPFPTSCDGPGRMNILLIGIDGFDANYYRAARSDTVILVGVNFADKTAQMLSIPRDLWVQMPGLPQVVESRINTAYHYGELYGVPGGGPVELSAVIANTFGLRVDRYAVVNFTAFEDGIDAIGGVDINIPAPIHDDKYPLRDGSGTIAIDFPEGPVHLDGNAALIYARTRHDSSDFQRMRRQQQIIFAVRDKLLSPETIPQLPALAQVLWGATRTDLSLEDIALLGCLATQIDASSIQTRVIDSGMTISTKLESGAQVLMPNMEAIQPILEQFNTGE
jgi:LCP family protein required for cell wall assembly